MTPDAVLHRYVTLVSERHVDTEAIYRLVAADADLLSRWLTSLDCPADPKEIRQALGDLDDPTLIGISRAQIWAVAPLGTTARLGFDQWRSVLRASCLAISISNAVDYQQAEAAQLQTLLAISGIKLAQDPLLSELIEFRGAAPELLTDAHPLLRMFAIIEAFEHQSEASAAELASELFGIEPGDFATMVEDAEHRCALIVADLALDDELGDNWFDELWVQAQLLAFSSVLGRQRDMQGLIEAADYAARGLFGQEPGYFFLDAEHGVLAGAENSELDALTIGLASSASLIAEALRAERPMELLEDVTGPVIDRQVLRRLRAERATAVPMIDAELPVGVLVLRLSDEDRAHAADTMAAFATELAGWVNVRRWDERQRTTLFEQYRGRHEKRLREIVHEANNPLSIINNYLHILELRLEGMPEAQEQLTMIGEEIRRTADIVRTVVDFPEVADGPTGAPPEPRRFEVNDVARKVIELLGGRAVATGIEVSQNLVPGVTVVSDEDRVTQVMINLARNAIEALHEGGVLQIETVPGVYRSGRAGVEFVVRDNGPGLAPDVLERLYEPKSSTKGPDHAGLGLHIIGRLVSELEGAIDVRTDSERGTAFSVFLPNLT